MQAFVGRQRFLTEGHNNGGSGGVPYLQAASTLCSCAALGRSASSVWEKRCSTRLELDCALELHCNQALASSLALSPPCRPASSVWEIQW